MPARDVVESHHTIPCSEPTNLLPDRSDSSRHLMPEDPGRGMGSGVDLLQVRSADATGINPYQNLARVDLGQAYDLWCDFVRSTVHGGKHGAGESFRHRTPSV